MFKTIPNWQLKKAYLRQTATLRKKTVTVIDDEYEQGTESFTNYPIDNCEIQPVTSEDLVWLPAGTLNVGDARGWFKELICMTICNSEFDTASLYTYDPDRIEIIDGEAKLYESVDPCDPYPINNPSISRTEGCVFSAPATEFKVVETIPAKTDIRYILSGDNGVTWYWWDGSAWAISDGTYTQPSTSQSSTSAEIIAHIATLPFTSGIWKWKAFLHSDDGTATPILSLVQMTFGLKIEVEDQVIDHQNVRYEVREITNYYTKDSVLLKECYLKKVVGEA